MALATLFAVVACDTPEEPKAPVLITFNPTTVEFEGDGGEQTITLSAKESWTAKAEDKWLTLTTTSGEAGEAIEFTLSATRNNALAVREGKVTFAIGNQNVELTIEQAASTTLDFFINPQGGYPGSSRTPEMLDSNYGPGHKITLLAGSDQAVITLLDYDYANAGCDTYSYLTTHNYPPVAGDKENAPTQSGYVVNADMTYFIISGVTYRPFMPTELTDEKGKPYGFNMAWTTMPNMDTNVCEIRIPVEDDKGNKGVVVGGFDGKMGYVFTPPPTNFDLKMFGFTAFEYQGNENNVVTLQSNSFVNGSFILQLTTTDGNIINGEDTPYSVEDKTLDGYFWDAETGAKFEFEKGSASIVAEDAANNAYILSVKSDILFSAPGLYTYKLAAGEHKITISNLP